jgi:FKBP-type peptidyl-prolyl cis-trans isomerase
MKIGLKTILAAGLGLAVLPPVSRAADAPASTPKTNAAAPMAEFKDDKEKASYGVGMYFGNMIKGNNLDVDLDTVIGAMKDVLAGKEMKLTEAQGRDAIRAYQMEAQKKAAEKNKKEGETFLAENKSKPGVKTHPVTLPDGTTAEMQYKVLKEGDGAMPKATDTVTVKYRGTLIDGKEFDNSEKHGGTSKFPVDGVVKGWTEALQMMKVGSKWELYLPSALAYGDQGRPGIPAGSVLIFEMELVGTEAPAPPPQAQPLTSDIIKVPSAEELKKGAKIEVIKPEEAARQAEEAAKAASNNPAKKP